MTVEIADVQRINGRVKEVSVWAGDIKITFRDLGQGIFKEVSRLRHSGHSLYIATQDYKDLYKKVYAIFKEERKVSKRV